MQAQQTIGMKIQLDGDYDAVLGRVVEALKAEGFGVLTEIDVRDTLKKKLDVDFRPYKILGACNPTLAHRALMTAPEVGLLLPCNVTVEHLDDGRVQVAIIDPLLMMGVVQDSSLQPVAEEAQQRLSRVIQALEG